MNPETLSLRTILNELDLWKKKVIIQWNAGKKNFLLLLATKSIERTCDPRNAKEHYQLFIRKKNAKSVKQ